MKTALYGIVCFLAGAIIETVRVAFGWPQLFGYVVGLVFVVFASLAGMVLEALTISRFVWGTDREDRYGR